MAAVFFNIEHLRLTVITDFLNMTGFTASRCFLTFLPLKDVLNYTQKKKLNANGNKTKHFVELNQPLFNKPEGLSGYILYTGWPALKVIQIKIRF